MWHLPTHTVKHMYVVLSCVVQGPVAVRVVVPKVSEKPEWNLHGQTLEFTFPLTDTVSLHSAVLITIDV